MPRERRRYSLTFREIANGRCFYHQRIRLVVSTLESQPIPLSGSLHLRQYLRTAVFDGSGCCEFGRWLLELLCFSAFRRNRIGGARAGVSLPTLFSWVLNSLIVNANTWASQY